MMASQRLTRLQLGFSDSDGPMHRAYLNFGMTL